MCQILHNLITKNSAFPPVIENLQFIKYKLLLSIFYVQSLKQCPDNEKNFKSSKHLAFCGF